MNHMISPYRYGVCETRFAEEVLVWIRSSYECNNSSLSPTSNTIGPSISGTERRLLPWITWSSNVVTHHTPGCHPPGDQRSREKERGVTPELISLSATHLSTSVTPKFLFFKKRLGKYSQSHVTIR